MKLDAKTLVHCCGFETVTPLSCSHFPVIELWQSHMSPNDETLTASLRRLKPTTLATTGVSASWTAQQRAPLRSSNILVESDFTAMNILLLPSNPPAIITTTAIEVSGSAQRLHQLEILGPAPPQLLHRSSDHYETRCPSG